MKTNKRLATSKFCKIVCSCNIILSMKMVSKLLFYNLLTITLRALVNMNLLRTFVNMNLRI